MQRKYVSQLHHLPQNLFVFYNQLRMYASIQNFYIKVFLLLNYSPCGSSWLRILYSISYTHKYIVQYSWFHSSLMWLQNSIVDGTWTHNCCIPNAVCYLLHYYYIKVESSILEIHSLMSTQFSRLVPRPLEFTLHCRLWGNWTLSFTLTVWYANHYTT